MSINREIESLNCLALINENSTLEEINEYIKKALIINPLCLEAYVLKSRVVASFIARGEILKEAISLINDKHDPKTIALVKEEYGKYLLENGSYQLAYEQFKDIITLFPLDNKGFRYLNRAILIHLEKDLKEVDEDNIDTELLNLLAAIKSLDKDIIHKIKTFKTKYPWLTNTYLALEENEDAYYYLSRYAFLLNSTPSFYQLIQDKEDLL